MSILFSSLRSRVALAAFLFALTSNVYAAEPASTVGSEASAFQRRAVEAAKLQKEPALKIDLPSDEELVSEEVAQKEFFVKEIRIDGAHEISVKELEPILKKFENRKLTLHKLRVMARNITQYYRLKGFITSRAYVPAQEVDHETVTIRVVEGKLGQVTFKGNTYSKTDWLSGYLTLKSGEVVTYKHLLADLNRLNRNPDRQVKAVLTKGQQRETSDILLNVKDSRPYHVGYSIDNHGTRLTGELRHSIVLEHSNVLGRDDAFRNTLTLSEGKDFLGEAASYVFPTTPTGGRFVASYVYSAVTLGKEFRDDNVKGGAHIGALDYIQPLVDAVNWSLGVDGGLQIKQVWSKVQGASNSKDYITILHAAPSVLIKDHWGATSIRNDVQVGIPEFMGSDDDQQFLINSISISRGQKFFFESLLLGRVEAQITRNTLVSAQQFRAGGYDTVRGYPEGDTLGDYGVLESLEWRVPPYFIPKDWMIPGTQTGFWQAVQLLTFIDAAQLYQRNPVDEKDKTLVGTGVGLRLSLLRNLSAQVDCGWPIGERPEDEAEYSPRIHFGVSLLF